MKVLFDKIAFFYVIGNPRSGTSLLRLMLNSHKDIVVPPECGFFHWLSSKYHRSDFTNILGFLDDYLSDLHNSRKFETWDIDFSLLRKSIIDISPSNYYELSILVYLSYARKFDKSPNIVGDKNNYYINHLAELDVLASNAKYLYIVRDCRDVVNSYKALQNLKTESPYKPNLPTNEEDIAKIWCDNNTTALHFFNSINCQRHYTVRFEDLLTKPIEILKNICAWLTIDFDEGMLRYHLDNCQYNIEPLSTLDWKKDTLQKPNPDKIGSYKKHLSTIEINNINTISEDLLSYFEYI